MNDLEQRLRTTLRHVAESTAVPAVPSPRPLGQRRPRRWLLAGAAGVGLLGAGGGLALAGGVRSDLFLGLEHNGFYDARSETARQLVVTPGPGSTSLVLAFADATDHGWCVAMYKLGTPTPTDLGSLGGACGGPVGGPDWLRFAGASMVNSGEDIGGAENITMFGVHVPGAARARVVLQDGSVVPVSVGQHWAAGYLTTEQVAQNPVLVGYDTDGREVGRTGIRKLG
jgi:hypothetical protein